MKKTICVLISALIIFISIAPAYAAEDGAPEMPGTSASAYVLYCPQNGKIILSKNENERRKPASTTKLMTSLITLEQAAKGNKSVTFTEKMTAEGSSMYLEYGDTLKLSDLAAGMMMCSGNDAANAAAIAVSGSFERFSELMNARAKSFGMKNTHFVTPSGLDDDDHYSTALDMSLLMAQVLKNKPLAELISQKSATVNFIKPDNKHMTYSNHNRLLKMYGDCIGGKTGYTTAAGRCLVSASKRDDLTLICVTLDDKNDWNDHIALYDYGFSKLACRKSSAFSADVPVLGGEADSVKVCADENVEFVVERNRLDDIRQRILLDGFLFAPVKKGARLGAVEYSLDGRVLCKADITAQSGTEYNNSRKGLFEKIKELFFNG